MTDHLDILKTMKDHDYDETPPPQPEARPLKERDFSRFHSGYKREEVIKKPLEYPQDAYESKIEVAEIRRWPMPRVLLIGLLVAILIYQQVRISQLSDRLEKPTLQPSMTMVPAVSTKVQDLEKRVQRLEQRVR